jgi:hypothetical protein
MFCYRCDRRFDNEKRANPNKCTMYGGGQCPPPGARQSALVKVRASAHGATAPRTLRTIRESCAAQSAISAAKGAGWRGSSSM